MELDNSDKETIQSKDSNKKQKDRKRKDYPLRQVLQQKLSMKENGTPGSEPGEGLLIGNTKRNIQQLDQRSEPE